MTDLNRAGDTRGLTRISPASQMKRRITMKVNRIVRLQASLDAERIELSHMRAELSLMKEDKC